MLSDKRILGIIGGMGPLATADLFKKIIVNTKADSDQEHLHILIDNNTDIPDRTQAILYGGPDPVPQLICSANRLRNAGADFLIIPCNTAHYFLPRIQEAVDIPILNMPEETALYLNRRGITKAGLLATEGTIKSGVYERTFCTHSIEILEPDCQEQKEIMKIIYNGVKAGRGDISCTAFENICKRLLERGAQTLVLGCTELPIAFSMYKINLPSVDPTLVLAEAAVRFANAQLRTK